MANFKRKGPKSTRAGCLLCKPHKRQGSPEQQRQRFSQYRKLEVAKEQVIEVCSRRPDCD